MRCWFLAIALNNRRDWPPSQWSFKTRKFCELRIESESVLNPNSYESLCSILVQIESDLPNGAVYTLPRDFLDPRQYCNHSTDHQHSSAGRSGATNAQSVSGSYKGPGGRGRCGRGPLPAPILAFLAKLRNNISGPQLYPVSVPWCPARTTRKHLRSPANVLYWYYWTGSDGSVWSRPLEAICLK